MVSEFYFDHFDLRNVYANVSVKLSRLNVLSIDNLISPGDSAGIRWLVTVDREYRRIHRNHKKMKR